MHCRLIARLTSKEYEFISAGPGSDQHASWLRRTTQASQAERSSPYTPASARLQAEIRAEWNQYFTDANFRVFCCLVCSERVFGHEAQWVAKSGLKCRDRGILEVLTDVHWRSDLRPTTYDFKEWRAAIIDPRGLHRRNDLEGQPIYFATDESSVQCSVCPGCYQSLFTCKSCAY
ncbi:BQ5605_C007g04870 [Microbotryum silenes-dioicae]|uniref:BQ5605_C007g04870 protein n=1 Tax=Microbotryum silenes-dioicae TaxID=796604 RepID=A0A2X0M881_9BASI|nr:BQ5605_C007g04870 [Microbotryum silenes-dioicae]